MGSNRPLSSDLSDYLLPARRHAWIVVLLAAACAVGVGALAQRRTGAYESTASVLVHAVGDTASPSGDVPAVNLGTESQLVTSTAVAASAAVLLHSSTPPDQLAARVTVRPLANSSVLHIACTATSAPDAQSCAHAFAVAYLQNRQAAAQSAVNGQASVLNQKIVQQQARLADVTAKMQAARLNSPDRANLDGQRQLLSDEINNLTAQANQLASAPTDPGAIISDAALPTAPHRLNVALYATVGGLFGLVLGVFVGYVRQRFDRRLRRPTDVPRRTGATLLGSLPKGARLPFSDVVPPYGADGRLFHRLRNEVLANLHDDEQVVVVTGAGRGCAATIVATNLAVALARAGGETALVCAPWPDGDHAPSAVDLLGVNTGPGLSDVLARSVDLAVALQRTPRQPLLQVLTAGATASSAGLLQSHTLRDVITKLRSRVDYVVIDAPSTATSADAQTLASLADVAVLTIELRRDRRRDINDAIEQLRRVGAGPLGAVVLDKVRRRRGDAKPRKGRLDQAIAGRQPAELTSGQAERDRLALLATNEDTRLTRAVAVTYNERPTSPYEDVHGIDDLNAPGLTYHDILAAPASPHVAANRAVRHLDEGDTDDELDSDTLDGERLSSVERPAADDDPDDDDMDDDDEDDPDEDDDLDDDLDDGEFEDDELKRKPAAKPGGWLRRSVPTGWPGLMRGARGARRAEPIAAEQTEAPADDKLGSLPAGARSTTG